MTTLRVLLHIAEQRDYKLHSLDFSTAFLQGSLHEKIWLRRPPGFTGSFPAGTQWSLRRPVCGLRQVPCEWHDTLRTTIAALGFAPSSADLSLFLRTNTILPPFYVLVCVARHSAVLSPIVSGGAGGVAVEGVGTGVAGASGAGSGGAGGVRVETTPEEDTGVVAEPGGVLAGGTGVPGGVVSGGSGSGGAGAGDPSIATPTLLTVRFVTRVQRLDRLEREEREWFERARQQQQQQQQQSQTEHQERVEEESRPPQQSRGGATPGEGGEAAGAGAAAADAEKAEQQRLIVQPDPAPREWHATLRTTLAALDFFPSSADPSLFVRRSSTPFFVLVYVDDLVFATPDRRALASVKEELQRDTLALTLILMRFRFPFSKVQPTPLAVDHGLTAPPLDEPFESSGPYPEQTTPHRTRPQDPTPALACHFDVATAVVAAAVAASAEAAAPAVAAVPVVAAAAVATAATAEQQLLWVRQQRQWQPPAPGPVGPGLFTHRYVGATAEVDTCVSSLGACVVSSLGASEALSVGAAATTSLVPAFVAGMVRGTGALTHQ
ncbi:unnamed protein product [Closterium sp. NIES-53]